MMAHLSAAGLMIRISTSQRWCRWWWPRRFGPSFHGSLVGGTSDGGVGRIHTVSLSPCPDPTFAIADWRAHLAMGVHSRPGLQEAHPTHPMACAAVRLFEAARHSRKSFTLQTFVNASGGDASDGVSVCCCLDTAPPDEGQSRCFYAPKHLGRVGYLLTLPNHRGSRCPRESHPQQQFSREPPPLPSSSRPLPPSPHSCPPSSPSEENDRMNPTATVGLRSGSRQCCMRNFGPAGARRAITCNTTGRDGHFATYN